MNTLAKLSAYGAALALLARGAYATGSAVGPLASAGLAAPAAGPASACVVEDAGHGDTHSGAVPETTDQPAGLASSRGGFTLTPTASTLTAGTVDDFAFRITGPDGATATAFDEEHTKRLHLIVVGRDTTGYQHLHPTMDPDGTWRTSLDLPAGGVYRAFAGFTPTGGAPTTLGADLSVAGVYEPVGHDPSRVTEVGGYQVRLDGDLIAGGLSPLACVDRHQGRCTGHRPAALPRRLRTPRRAARHRPGLSARAPRRQPGDGRTLAGPQIRFVAEVPSSADYRLFLDFQPAGTVHTAEFTVPTGPPTSAPDAMNPDETSGAVATHTDTHARTVGEGH